MPAGLGDLIAAERGRRELRERAEAWLRRAGALARERAGLLARAAPTGDAVTDMTGYFNGWREKAEAAAAEGTALAGDMRRRSAGPLANRVAVKARELRTGLDRDWDVWHLERDIERHRSGAVRAGTDPYAADGADGIAARAEALEALPLRPGEASYRIRDFVDGHREHAVRRREFEGLLAAVRRCARERDRLLAAAGDRDLPFRAVLRTRPGLWRWHGKARAAAVACRKLLTGPERYGAFLDAVPDGYGLVRRTLDTVRRARELDNLPAGLLRRLRNNAAEADAAGIDPRVTDAYPGIVGALERLASPRLVSRADTRSVAEGLVRDYGPVGEARELILETRRDAAACLAGRNALEAMGAGRAIPRLEGYDRWNAGARAVREACRTILRDRYGPCGLHLARSPAVRRELDDAAGLIGRALAADAPELGAIRAEQERRHLELERQLRAAQAERDRDEAERMVRRLGQELEMERREREAERQGRRLEEEAERRRVAEEAERRRVAEEAERRRSARRGERRRVRGPGRGISRGGGRSM